VGKKRALRSTMQSNAINAETEFCSRKGEPIKTNLFNTKLFDLCFHLLNQQIIDFTVY
jgi:hypothetical protein